MGSQVKHRAMNDKKQSTYNVFDFVKGEDLTSQLMLTSSFKESLSKGLGLAKLATVEDDKGEACCHPWQPRLHL